MILARPSILFIAYFMLLGGSVHMLDGRLRVTSGVALILYIFNKKLQNMILTDTVSIIMHIYVQKQKKKEQKDRNPHKVYMIWHRIVAWCVWQSSLRDCSPLLLWVLNV
ncbi:hypothetical protein ACJX0J_017879, partial [Zea mays]